MQGRPSSALHRPPVRNDAVGKWRDSVYHRPFIMPRLLPALAALLLVLSVAPSRASADACSNPPQPNGTPCSGACTLAGACQGGVCTGPAFFTCAAVDQCHGAGTCNPGATVDHQDGGQFSGSYGCNPSVHATSTNGLACSGVGCGYVCSNDSGLSYTFNTTPGLSYTVLVKVADYLHNCQDAVQASVVADGNVVATWQGAGIDDWAYIVAGFTATAATTVITVTEDNDVWCGGNGSCDPACNPLYDDLNLDVDGVFVSPNLCSGPALPNGTACDDHNDCTPSSACQGGVCTGSNPAPDGTACQQGSDLCTTGAVCQGGSCTGGSPIVCTPPSPCYIVIGACDPSTGVCAFSQKADDAECDDGDACTLDDYCAAGRCIPSSTVQCTAKDNCHVAGTCDAATGLCDDPPAPEGSPCDDGNLCTQPGTCSAGVCMGGLPIACPKPDECHEPADCDPSIGTCDYKVKADGSPCPNGACQAGSCIEAPGTGDPDAGHAGGGGGGPDDGGAFAQEEPGCGCDVPGSRGDRGAVALALALFALARRRARPIGKRP